MYRYVIPFLLFVGVLVNGCSSIPTLYGKEANNNFWRLGLSTSYFEVEIGVDECVVESFVLPEKRLVDNVCNILADIIEVNRNGRWVWESYKYKKGTQSIK